MSAKKSALLASAVWLVSADLTAYAVEGAGRVAYPSSAPATAAPAAGAQETAQHEAPAASSSDVIVPARGREEALQDVPIANTALPESALIVQNDTSTIELSRTTPSLQITRSAQGQRHLCQVDRDHIRGLLSCSAPPVKTDVVASDRSSRRVEI